MLINLASYDKTRLEKKHNEGITSNGAMYGVSAMQGWRPEMEDTHTIHTNVLGCPDWSLFAVFDGHGGSLSSELAARNLVKHFENALLGKIESCRLPSHSAQSSSSTQTFTSDKSGIAASSSHAKLRGLSDEKIMQAIRDSFFTLDKYLLRELKEQEDKSGTTVVAALITDRSTFLINSGDSRAILVRNDLVELQTFDHKPFNLKERQRIQNAGGLIALNRVNGGLATSRGLGDIEYKNIACLEEHRQFISFEPDIYISERHADDCFLVLACDGIWDVMKNDEVKEFISAKLKIKECLMKICDNILDHCLEKGSRDNMSIIVVDFNNGNLRSYI